MWKEEHNVNVVGESSSKEYKVFGKRICGEGERMSSIWFPLNILFD